MAKSYANSRPSVHQPICRRIAERLSPRARLRVALDAGCGAGASTAALLPYADHVHGLDPFPEMLLQARAKVPGATFTLGSLESLPYESSAFQLVATAGALNYTDVHVALTEIHRVLKPQGWLAAYDFSAGRRLSSESDLPSAYATFRSTFPGSPGYALDLRRLPYDACGLTLLAAETHWIGVSMTGEQYVQYLLGDSGVQAAIDAGADEQEIKELCSGLFLPIFGGRPREVLFEAELVLSKKQSKVSNLNDA